MDQPDIIARLADEGVPICAIARALKTPSGDVREVLHSAMFDGAIVEYPKEDWPPGQRRNNFTAITDGFVDTDDKIRNACSRYFGTTRQQSVVLGYLLKRSEATKEQLHQAIEATRGDSKDETDAKLVDVLVCIIRKKLKLHELSIKTMWGRGYLIEAKERARAVFLLNKFMRQANSIEAEEIETKEAA